MHFIFTGAHALCSALYGRGGLGNYYILELVIILIAWRVLQRINPAASPVATAVISWIIANTGLWLISVIVISL